MAAEMGKDYPLPEGKGNFQVTDVRTDIMRLGPAVLITVKSEDGKPGDFWIFENQEMVMKRLPAPMAKSAEIQSFVLQAVHFFFEGNSNEILYRPAGEQGSGSIHGLGRLFFHHCRPFCFLLHVPSEDMGAR